MQESHRSGSVLLGIFSLAGLIFSAFSAFDFIAHLDRQVHAITCSYVPGLGKADVSGSSGCYAVLMSPYSSVLRTWTWGGIPIALPGLAVFAYLLFRAVDLGWRKAAQDRVETRFLIAATALPLITSAVYFWVSVELVGAVCKLCVGMYVSSLGVFVAALWMYWRGRGAEAADEEQGNVWGRYLLYFAEGVAFVFVPVVLYLLLKPDYGTALGDCGQLRHPEDKYGVRVKLNNSPGGMPALEVLDPLCPACKHFSERLQASGLANRLKLEAVLFPLDNECNWMVSESLHPGACATSEALLCAGDQMPRVLNWIFAHQEELRLLAETDNARLYERLRREFPALAKCLDQPAVKTRLNRSLRWAVANSLPVLAPQLYLGDQKVCDEDTDLGLEYTLTQILAAQPSTRPRSKP